MELRFMFKQTNFNVSTPDIVKHCSSNTCSKVVLIVITYFIVHIILTLINFPEQSIGVFF